MKTSIRLLSAMLPLAAVFWISDIRAQGPAFTFQGQLSQDGGPASGLFDFTFTLHDMGAGGVLVAGPLTNGAVLVSNGLFAATLDFGAEAFDGSDLWLEISVRTNGAGAFVPLEPRQPVTATPYAITAANVSGSGLAGTFSGAVTFGNPSNVFNGNFTGSGSGLVGVDAASVGGVAAGDLWRTTGNSGTTAGSHFLGTTDEQALEFRVNNERALRLEPAPEVPNVIGGSASNSVAPGNKAGTIAGGGLPAFPNTISADFASIGGGTFHGVSGHWGTIAGGRDNRVHADHASVVGGRGNTVHSNAQYAIIGSGIFNQVWTNSTSAVIGGGSQNVISNDSAGAAIVGGSVNRVWTNSPFAFIGAGSGNEIQSTSSRSLIIGGSGNIISNNSAYASIAGGQQNRVHTNSAFATIGGGKFNQALAEETTVAGGAFNQALAFSAAIGGGGGHRVESTWAVVAGGRDNRIGTNSSYATVGGGFNNRIDSGYGATIAGGIQNHSQSNAAYATIGGGLVNIIEPEANLSTIGGGWTNRIAAETTLATISGGLRNHAGGHASVIGGGSYNTNNGSYGVVPGGDRNFVSGQNGLAAGHRARAVHDGAFVWADSQDADFASTGENQFLVRAAGGVGINTANPTAGLHVGGTPGVDGIRFPDGTLQTTAANTPSTAPEVFFASGSGSNPTASIAFLAQPVTVTITSTDQKVLVTSHKAFGSTAINGANDLDLYIGYRPAGSAGTPNTAGTGIFDNRVPNSTRVTMGMSGVITGLAPGNYQVGLAGRSGDAANWNFNEYSHTTAVVY